MKKISGIIIVIFISTFGFYLCKSGKDTGSIAVEKTGSLEADLSQKLKSGNSSELGLESVFLNLEQKDSPKSENLKSDENVKSEKFEEIEISKMPEFSNLHKPETPMTRLAKVLADKLASEGFSETIGTCIIKAAELNLKSEKPRSFDEMADNCSELNGIAEVQKNSIRKIFHDSIIESRSVVNIEKWFKCATAKKLSGSACLNEHFQSLVNNFYAENRGNLKLAGSEFDRLWSESVADSIENLIKNCPQLPTSLTEVYANECNR